MDRRSTEIKALPNLTSLGERVKWARKEKGMSQAVLADKVGTDQTTISQIERGIIIQPRNPNRLAEVLDISEAWMAYGKEDIDKLTNRSINLALAFETLTDADKAILENVLHKFK